MAQKSTAEWVSILEEARVPHGPINSVDMVVADPQVLAREMVVDVAHPVAGDTKLPGIPIKMDLTPGEIKTPAPTLGQHTQEILTELLGYDAEKIARLEEEGIF